MSFNADKYLVNQNASIKEALKKIEQNHFGFIFSCDDQGKVLGLATDRTFEDHDKGLSIDESISKCTNANFISADQSTSREKLIKGWMVI